MVQSMTPSLDAREEMEEDGGEIRGGGQYFKGKTVGLGLAILA